MAGWVKLYRSIQDHWIWDNPVYLKWWLDLILMANHKPNKVLVNGEIETIDIGERLTSEVKLSERWEVDRKTVRKFLSLLEKEGMISVKKSRQKGTTYKVSKYKDYQQSFDGVRDIKKDNDIPNGVNNDMDIGMDNAMDINKNEKNENNDKNKDINVTTRKKRVYDDDDPNKKLAILLLKKIRERQDVKEPDLNSWANTIRLTIEMDKRKGKEVQDMIIWSSNHDFWSGVILSPTSLRKNFDKMSIQMKQKPNNSNKFSSSRKETLPDWVGKSVKETPMSEEKQAEFRKQLEELERGK